MFSKVSNIENTNTYYINRESMKTNYQIWAAKMDEYQMWKL